MAASTAVSVVVASHGRDLRLRWLLNALEEQTLEASRWDVVVVHDYDEATARRVFDGHPLHEVGLREIRIPAGTGPGTKRNLGWRAAAGDLVAFTDDDCRPEPDWLARLVDAARRAPGQVVQGATRPDPLEADVMAAPHVRTQEIDPVTVLAQTCNILYPRELLERVGGLEESLPHPAGEDVDLALRARVAGATLVPAPDAVVNHAVESHTLPEIVRFNLRWGDLAYLVKRHPGLRRSLPLGVFWDEHHLRVTAAVLGLGAARRRPWAALLAVPYLSWALRRRGTEIRSYAIGLVEAPGQAVRHAAEAAGLVAGSVRHRTFLL